MVVKGKIYEDILKEELILAAGCTEPTAIAYISSKCAELLGEEVLSVNISLSSYIIKNVMGVVIPNTNYMGIEYAIAIGQQLKAGHSDLEFLSDLPKEVIDLAQVIYNKGNITITEADNESPLYMYITMKGKNHTAEVEVCHVHTNITLMRKDNKELYFNPCNLADFNSSLTNRENLSVQSIIEYTTKMDLSNIKPILDMQLKYNSEIALVGKTEDYGESVGKTLYENADGSKLEMIKGFAACGSDARMGGAKNPVVINSGSGNQGLLLSNSLFEYFNLHNVDKETQYRALAMANLLAIHVKSRIGRLSTLCGALTASTGLSAAFVYLKGGTTKQMGYAINNQISNIMGMICDGAKSSCALKIASSVDAAMLSANMAIKDRVVRGGIGIISKDPEDTINNAADIALGSMVAEGKQILDIMLESNKK